MKLPSTTLLFSLLASVAVVDVNIVNAQSQANCPVASAIVDGENCCEFIPADAFEKACFIDGGATQCRCAGQDDICATIGWSCISTPTTDVSPVTAPTASPVNTIAVPTTDVIPVTAPTASPVNTVAPVPTTDVIPVTTPTASPVNTIVISPTDATTIPAPAPTDSTDSTEPTETPNFVPIVDTIAPTASVDPPSPDEPVEPVEPVEDCSGEVCDPTDADACSCRPGLICRSRATSSGLNFRCSAEPREGRTRLSSGRGGAGGAAPNRGNTRTTRVPPYVRRV